MNDPSARRRSEKTSGRRRPESSQQSGRSAPWGYLAPPIPALVVRVDIEAAEPEFYIECATDEDERSLRRWLRTNPPAVAELVEGIGEILDDLRDAA
jgi:hypothetical protein